MTIRMYCLKCGYPLDGLNEHRCPECGRKFDPTDERTYEPTGKRGGIGRRFLWASAFCSAYALLLIVLMIAMIVIRLAGFNRGMELAEIVSALLGCGAPFFFIANLVLLVAAPLAADKARRRMQPCWWITALFAVAAWGGAAALFFTYGAADDLTGRWIERS